ncbi:MAG: ABC transporter ATP-binding protein [Fibrobacteres bacterium]|nr:ABC transporter ATP-binding protein [Fibrobacterota bacterium]
MNEKLLSIENISKAYSDAEKSLQVISELSFSLRSGEVVALMGESGAGKTTLLNLLGLLDTPDSGKIIFDGTDVSGYSEGERAFFRNAKIGFLFQFHHLLSDFSAVENAIMPGLIRNGNKEELESKAVQLLDRVGLSKRLKHLPSELSGGEQQRVAMVRSLINDPLLVLADEPTGNLDEYNSSQFIDMALQMVRDTGRSFLIATHSSRISERCDRILRLAHGKIEGDK